jgi:hypothetical protein
MAKQKPAAKTADVKKPTYSAAETKKIGAGYDQIGFKNSAIDAVKGKMDKFASDFTAENKDIVPTHLIPSSIKSRIPEKAGKDAWVAEGGYFEPNDRNQTLTNTFEKKGALTGKTGMSISEYGLNKGKISSYLASPTAGTTERFKRKK